MRNRFTSLTCTIALLATTSYDTSNAPIFVGLSRAAEAGADVVGDAQQPPLGERTTLLNKAIRAGGSKQVEFLADCLLDKREVQSAALNPEALEIWRRRSYVNVLGNGKEEPILISRLAAEVLVLSPRGTNSCLLNRVREFDTTSRVNGDMPWTSTDMEIVRAYLGLLIRMHEGRLGSAIHKVNKARPKDEQFPNFDVDLEYEETVKASVPALGVSARKSTGGTFALGYVVGIDPALNAMAEKDRQFPKKEPDTIYVTRSNLLKLAEIVVSSELPKPDRQAGDR